VKKSVQAMGSTCVYDVTGAGDTVVATMGLALSCNVSLMVSALMANQAAGVVVGKVGLAIPTHGDLMIDKLPARYTS